MCNSETDSGLYSPLITKFDGPVWSVIQIMNSINHSLADEHIRYEEWKKFMSICSEILERITL